MSGASGVLASSAVAYSAPTVGDPGRHAARRRGRAAQRVRDPDRQAWRPPTRAAWAPCRRATAEQDITYLANKTGWDARVVALAALADQFSQLTAPRARARRRTRGRRRTWPVPVVSLQPEFYYALFRAGLPASADALFRTSPAGVRASGSRRRGQGIIPSALAGRSRTPSPRLPGAQRRPPADRRSPGRACPRWTRCCGRCCPRRAAGTASPGFRAVHQGDWSDFWTEVDRQAGTSAAGRLRLIGQLYYLTHNNEPLVTALLAAETEPPLQSTADLAARGYYDAASGRR